MSQDLYKTDRQTIIANRMDDIKITSEMYFDSDGKIKYFLRLSNNNLGFRSGMYMHRNRLKIIAEVDDYFAVMDYDE